MKRLAWIAGTTIALDNAPTVNAIIHATGSLLARDVSIGADSTLHFDRAVLEAGTACGAPAAAVVP